MKYQDKKFFLEPSYTVWKTKRQGPDYATDQAIGEFLSLAIGEIIPSMQRKRVDFCYEYKPRVPSDPKDVEPWHLSEVVLQAYYLKQQPLQQNCMLLHCLTDLTDFHYMAMAIARP